MRDFSVVNPVSIATLKRPVWLPDGGEIVVVGHNEDSIWGTARSGGRVIAQLTWSPEGRLLHEKPMDGLGRGHGIEIRHDDEGRVVWCARWVDGQLHGPVVQLRDDGTPVVLTRFERGCGVDVWTQCGEVTEVREMDQGVPHGSVRWGAPTEPWEEGGYAHGKRHGILRRWNPDGSLCIGFPRFHIDDLEVSQDRYETTARSDPSLPPYRAGDDANRRPLPPVVREALRRAAELADGFSLAEYMAS